MNLPPIDQKILFSRVAAGKALSTSAAVASLKIDSFGSWILAGTGAGLAFVFSNAGATQSFITAGHLAGTGPLFVTAFVLCALQKYLSIIVTGSNESSKELMKDSADFEKMDTNEFFRVFLASYPRPMRWIMVWVIRELEKGNFAVAGRLMVRTVCIQGVVMLLELIAILVIVWRVLL